MQPEKSLLAFMRTTLIGGVIFLLPIALIVILQRQGFGLTVQC